MANTRRIGRRSFFEKASSWSLLSAVAALGAFLVRRRPSGTPPGCRTSEVCRTCSELRDCPLPFAKDQRRLDPRFSMPRRVARKVNQNV